MPKETAILRQIKRLVRAGAWIISEHAYARAGERGDLHQSDIENALLEAWDAELQRHGPWLVYGPDLAGSEVAMVVEVSDSVLVVTVLS